ncbi:MAG: alkaline phosphatase family protein [Anaerolineae bacterium]|nr:alkaline phosphatase family protein [Anaerolineae bacterium]
MFNLPISYFLRKFFCKRVAYLAAIVVPLLGYASFIIPLYPFVIGSQPDQPANSPAQAESIAAQPRAQLVSIRFGRSSTGTGDTAAVPKSPTVDPPVISNSTPLKVLAPTFTPAPVDTVAPAVVSTASPTPFGKTSGLLVPTDLPIPTLPPLPTATAAPPITTTTALTEVAEAGLKYAMIISIDGLRPDALLLAHTPTLDKLLERGSYCPQAQTIANSITLPSHASMLTGMLPEKHGIEWGLPYMGWPGMEGPSLFTVAKQAGLTTAMVFGKDKLHYIALKNTVDHLYGGDVHDTEVKAWAIEVIQTGMPEVMFVHFPDTDRVGHAYGWMSENQFQSITFVDGLIGEIVAELEAGGYLINTMFIVSADHGGHGFGHGDDAPEDRTIPWLAAGPGIKQGFIIERQINTYDTAVTVAHALDLPVPSKWDGQPVLEIFEE